MFGQIQEFLFWSTFLLYLLITLSYFIFIILEKQNYLKYASRATALALNLQTILLAFLLYQYKGFNAWSISHIFLLSSWALVVVYSIYNFKYKLKAIGALVFIFVNLFYTLSLLFSDHFFGTEAFRYSVWAGIHMVMVFLSLSVFLLAFIVAILFLIQEMQIKHKKAGKLLTRLPSLQSMDRVHTRALSIGFICLTFAIMTGSLWAKQVHGQIFFNDPRQMWSICAWLLYGLFLQGRFTAHWKGRKGMLLSCLGFVIILFTFLGVGHR